MSINATNVREKINSLDLSKPIDERQFYELILLFRNQFLEVKDYRKNYSKHRKPKEYLNEVLQASFDRLREMGTQEEMSDVEIKEGKTSHSYVYTRVRSIFEADKKLNLYNSIKEYCRITNKDFNSIAVLMAEYRGLEKVRGRIRMDSQKLERKIELRSGRNFANSSSVNDIVAEPHNLLSVQSEIISKLPSANLLSALSMQTGMTKTMSSFNYILKASQDHHGLFRGAEAAAKMMSADNQVFRTLKQAGMVSRLFDSRPVLPSDMERYARILATLAHSYSAEITPATITDDNSLLEVEYVFPQIEERMNETETGSGLILLNEARSIRKIILDIYKDNHKLLDVTSRQFEEMIAELLSSQGFQVELTKQTRDGGYDILALYPMANQTAQKWLVECKRLTREKVGVEIIRSFKEVIQANNVNRGIIATTSYFSAVAMKKQQETPYLLDFRDKDAVMDWIQDYGNQTKQ